MLCDNQTGACFTKCATLVHERLVSERIAAIIPWLAVALSVAFTVYAFTTMSQERYDRMEGPWTICLAIGVATWVIVRKLDELKR
ncbi:hypothetical protein [Sphingomonas antarctica]|uniref:hypothetical protein n=1 Tax=Sphingomonas antarctica TaxID=2040274 RepID=UPI0039EC455D